MTADIRTTTPSGAGDVQSHFAIFQRLVARAEDLLGTGRHEEAALCGQAAAGHAWYNHPGTFSSCRLERVLCAIGHEACVTARFSGTETRRPPRSGRPEHVLHVLTQAYAIGGHTRLVWRWIQRDSARAHSVVLTGQRGEDVPRRLREAVEGSRGALSFLDRETGSLVRQAKALRELAVSSDRVVLHIHPHDVVPLMALVPGDDLPPVIFLNHADHVFWLGVSISHVVASLRESGLRLARDRRGVEDRRCVLFPIPLTCPERALSRRDAKAQLGLPDDSVVILSVASAYKYAGTEGISFTDAIAPVLERHGHAVMVTIGPGLEGPWRGAEACVPGRLLPLGVQDDVTPFYQAADIYVDSFPFSSLTSLLEAGSYGLPVVSYCCHAEPAAVLCADDPALSDGLMRMTSVEELRETVSRLVEDGELRARLGERTRDDILGVHAGPGWQGALERVYLCADACGQIGIVPSSREDATSNALDAALVRLQAHSGNPRDLETWAAVQIGGVLTLRDTAQVALARDYAINMLRAFPWLTRAHRVRAVVVSSICRAALASREPLRVAARACADLWAIAHAGGTVDRAPMRRLVTQVWAELAVTARSGPSKSDRVAASAAIRAVLHDPSHVGRTLLRFVARRLVPGQAVPRRTIVTGRGR